jgi:hypothetical protein
MRKRSGFAAVVITLLAAGSASALSVGRPVLVAPNPDASQQNVVVSRDSSRTLIAFDEIVDGASPARVVLHQYEALLGIPRGRETFVVAPSELNQRRPALGSMMTAWVAENGQASLWYQASYAHTVGANFEPGGTAERVAAVAAGTRIAVFTTHVFHVLVWTAPDGRLATAERSLIARIGYDPTPWFLTVDAAINPAVTHTPSPNPPLVAYNHPVTLDGTTRHSVRATTIWSRDAQPAIDIAPAGASAPRVVFNGTDFFVLWSMEDGTWAQRVSTQGGQAMKLGAARKIAEGQLHDASAGPRGDTFVVVDYGTQFALLRFDGELDRVDGARFTANLAPGAKISLSAHYYASPMLAYAEIDPARATRSRAVFRLVDDGTTVARRRSVR